MWGGLLPSQKKGIFKTFPKIIKEEKKKKSLKGEGPGRARTPQRKEACYSPGREKNGWKSFRNKERCDEQPSV